MTILISFNPKAGLSFEINDKNQLYASYARANREPNRTDYENGSPRPEKLNDLEFGLRHNTAKVKLNANVLLYGPRPIDINRRVRCRCANS
jgi:iron complex outermembrane receptor protein